MKKTSLPPKKDRAQLETLLSHQRRDTIALQSIYISIEEQIRTIEQAHQDSIAILQNRIDARFIAAKKWAEANPAEFAKTKTLQLVHGTLGFRTSPPAVKPISKKFTPSKIIGLLRSYLPGCIRTKEEIDREIVLSLAAGEHPNSPIMQKIEKCGLKIEQSEKFFLEPKLDQIDPRQTCVIPSDPSYKSDKAA